MSNIPLARSKLLSAQSCKRMVEVQFLIKQSLALLDRRKPKFKAPPENPGLTRAGRRKARALRREGYSIHRIALILHTTHGRISEAVSGKAHP